MFNHRVCFHDKLSLESILNMCSRHDKLTKSVGQKHISRLRIKIIDIGIT